LRSHRRDAVRSQSAVSSVFRSASDISKGASTLRARLMKAARDIIAMGEVLVPLFPAHAFPMHPATVPATVPKQ
jgi:hypothetical protein